MLSESVLGFVLSLFQSISGIESLVYTMLWYLYTQPLESIKCWHVQLYTDTVDRATPHVLSHPNHWIINHYASASLP